MAEIKNLKPLVITTRNVQASGSEYIWNKLQNPEVFIGGIITQEVNIENSDELNKLISGIPTPFARTAMFKYAINYVGQAGEELTGLMSFYKTLQDEWKGLVACIALDNQPLSIEKIILDYSDNKSIEETLNLYEPKGSIGNMLFEDKSMWCNQQEQLDITRKNSPFLYVIRYNGTVIGATSPESFLFTAPVYNINSNKGFYSSITKKFTDPLNASLTREEIEKLYVYVNHINNSIDAFVAQFTRKVPDVQRISTFLNNWLSEIRLKAESSGYEIDENAIVPNLNKFKPPFDKLFNFQTTLYGYGGRISSDITTLNLPEGISAVEVELAELLLNPDLCTVSEIIFDDTKDAANSGVHMLKAISDKGDRYFTLPLSEKGLAIFQDEIEGLLESGGDIRSNLTSIYDLETKTLQVTLQVDVNGNITSFTKKYKEPVKINGQKVICWPDFISKIWNKYYLYSELPHNAPELKVFPLRANKNDFRLITEIIDGKYQFKKIAVNGKKINSDDSADIIVEYDINKLGSSDLKYEIYESTEPFKGVEFQFKSKPSGYLIFKKIETSPSTLKDRRVNSLDIPVRVGFDFGSNNICISYSDIGGSPKTVTFKNRRKFLLGSEISNNDKVPAVPHEVFFFQNEQTDGNFVKSMIMIHDEKRLKDIEVDPKKVISEAVKGGFPVFEKNMPVENSDDNTHFIKFSSQPSHMKYNMKWSNNDKENGYKEGLLKLLWLKTYAELYAERRYPVALIWAYPSSMNVQILTKYNNLWDQVAKENPLSGIENAVVAKFFDRFRSSSATNDSSTGRRGGIKRGNVTEQITNEIITQPINGLYAQTEAAAVCKFAISVKLLNVDPRSIIIGFDVGGSTTDVLCISDKKSGDASNPDNSEATLIKQSSIKFAAGRIADATKKSKKFQEVLKSYCRKKELHIHGITVLPEKLNSNTSPFYYNLIVDRLKDESELSEFYTIIAADCPELFVLNAYITGLILFYSGKLANRIHNEQTNNTRDFTGVFENVTLGFFGKGGRIFDWLLAVNETSGFDYYQACFDSGYGPNSQKDVKQFFIEPCDNSLVKTEVSFGLSSEYKLNIHSDTIKELIGEEGYTSNGALIESFDAVEINYMQNFGKSQFLPPREFKTFNSFFDIFSEYSKQTFGVNLSNLKDQINSMSLAPYVQNIPEYKMAASRPEEFDFEAPVIVLEGMCFLDTILMEKLFGK